MNNNQKLTPDDINYAKDLINKLALQFKQSVVGQDYLFNRLILALFSKSHILVEGVPGLAKTRAINTIAKAMQLAFTRVQFTPDLLPSDIVGNLVFNPKEGNFLVKLGPVFSNILLADEINRAPAKVQSALLESMAENQVTIGDKTYKIERPFMVMATQNPIEQEGTFPLPEAQVDRFALKAIVNYPTLEEEIQMLDLLETKEEVTDEKIATKEELLKVQELASQITVSSQIKRYIAAVVNCTRYPGQFGLADLTKVVEFGASPRASIAFMQLSKVLALTQGRDHVIPEDIKELGLDILRHRIVLSFEAQAEGVNVEGVIKKIFNTVHIP